MLLKYSTINLQRRPSGQIVLDQISKTTDFIDGRQKAGQVGYEEHFKYLFRAQSDKVLKVIDSLKTVFQLMNLLTLKPGHVGYKIFHTLNVLLRTQSAGI